MSQYVSQLHQGDPNKGIRPGRDQVGNWPACGTWDNSAHFNDLKKFGDALDVRESAGGTDLLNSIPTPWARVLLFESALHDKNHPAHDEVTKQWRGLLGVLALAEGLGLKPIATPYQIGLGRLAPLIQAFRDLKPKDLRRGKDGNLAELADHWTVFHIISTDGIVLGSTSPRTLVFTSIAHHCPDTIPFRSEEGRLTDPVAYYARLRDAHTLGLLKLWVGQLKAKFTLADQQGEAGAVTADDPAGWFGVVPGATSNDDRTRSSLLGERLQEWEDEAQEALLNLGGMAIKPPSAIEPQAGPFTEFPYNLVQQIKPDDHHQSDLFIERRETQRNPAGQTSKKLSGFNRRDSDIIVEQRGGPYRGPLQIWDERRVDLSQYDGPIVLPNIEGYEPLNDPSAELFESALIRVLLPENPRWTYGLTVGKSTFLFPYKEGILNLLSNEQINKYTKLTSLDAEFARVELTIPVQHSRYIRAHKDFRISEITDRPTPEIAVWPDFTHANWNRYFYFIHTPTTTAIDVAPHAPEKLVDRAYGDDRWLAVEKPLRAFEGFADGNRGLLLLKRNDLQRDPATKNWKVAVDFGSTHTRAFYVTMDKPGGEYTHEDIKPIEFKTLSQSITYCTPAYLQQNFFAFEGELTPPARQELKSLLMRPDLNSALESPWLPREGYVYPHWLLDAAYDAEHLRHELKWSATDDGRELYSFLSSLMAMIGAEALKEGAQVISIRHAYPSVLTRNLRAIQNDKWNAVSNGKTRPVPLTEAQAVCSYLTWAVGANPSLNTISLDVGGSTSDLALWGDNALKTQESLKLAADVVGRFIQSAAGGDFRIWLIRTLAEPNYGPLRIDLDRFASKKDGYSLMFSNVLTYLEWQGKLRDLIERIKAAPQAAGLVSVLTFLFSSLLYYAGVLARRSGLTGSNVQLYFCGKGGTLITWLNDYDKLAGQMFQAGLGRTDITLATHISPLPKQEVGRGLLALALEGLNAQNVEAAGQVTNEPWPVTAGETGYEYKDADDHQRKMEWNSMLDEEKVKNLCKVPATESLVELNNFVNRFREGGATEASATLLGLGKGIPEQFWSSLHARFFSPASGNIQYDAKHNRTLLEPLFITEVKVLAGLLTPPVDLYR